MENILLHILLFTPVLEHCCDTLGTTHPATQTGTDLRGVNVLIELIGISDARHGQGFSGTDEGPKSSTIDLSDDVFGNTVTASRPPRGNLTSDETVEVERLGNDDASTFLEFDVPLARCCGPNIDLVLMLQLELVCFGLGNFERLEIMVELNLLVEGLFERVIAVEELGLCRNV